MRLFSVLWALGVRLSPSLFVQDLVLRSPPSISQCEQVFVSWEGGQAPYSLVGFSNGLQIFDISNLTAPRHDFGVVLHDATEGDIVVIRLRDGARTARYASYRVQHSEDHSCLRGLPDKPTSGASHPTWRDPPSAAISPLRSEDNALATDPYAQSLVSFSTPRSGPTPNNFLVEAGDDPR